ncbi:MAG: hypothetical protein HPY55_02975 [Firmicutes bacterium]|nr:hypothetical protein [Bacillota bacterium]
MGSFFSRRAVSARPAPGPVPLEPVPASQPTAAPAETPETPATPVEAEQVRSESAAVAESLQQVIGGLEAVVARTSMGSARNALRLKALASRIQDSYAGMRQISEAAKQIQQGIQVVASSAGDAAQVAKKVQEESESGHDCGRQAEEATRTVQRQIHDMTVRLETLVEQVRDVTRVTGILNEITAQTRLLALNAAIEAARAGDHGRGFAVVANEVRALADKAATQTKEIDALVREITSQLAPVQASVTQSRDLADMATRHAAEASQSLEAIRSLASQSAMHMEQVAAAVEEQTALMESLHASARQATEGLDGVQQEAGHISQATVHVSQVSEEAYQYLGRFDANTTFHRVLKEIRRLAVDGRRVLEQVIDQGKVTLDDVLRLQYTEITGPAIRSLARLFDVSRVPPSGFTPPKYSTAYDSLVDERIQDLLDAALERERAIDTATIIDLNGYIPAHPRKFCKDWTGIPEQDLVRNRMKRIYLGASLRGARVAIPNAERLPERVTREDLVRAGIDLRERAAVAGEFLVQAYARDTGEVVFLVTVPVFVKGYRFGAATGTWRVE